ncbi:DUF58 domain-containing protein [Natronosalvus vescus]|uniref:DUF58 domain-containing protein n=1 Tax=Natronosalvus vescus TaxID=2953881 RepID=UPI0020902FBB|nr:DUF58 domain-containing protein [Natronosalvus vescus]
MRLSRRGWAALGVIAFCLLMGAQFGSRALDAVVAPLVLILAAGVVTAYRTTRPEIDRLPIEEGYPNERRTVELAVEVETPLSATVVDALPDGVSAVDGRNAVETTLLDGEPIRYEIDLESRGQHAVGPLTVTITDLFGLVERRFRYAQTSDVLVYPRVYDLRGGAKHDLQLLRDAVGRYDREEFDHLREYERGDSLRDIHWKSAAKRADGELVVKEFVADGRVGSVELTAECTPGYADDLATAVASVATYLLREEVAVGVALPEATLEAETGERHQLEMLRRLAVLEPGEADDRARTGADVLIQADTTGVVVIVEGHEIPFERLSGRIDPDTVAGRGADESATSREPGSSDDRSNAGTGTGVSAHA